MSGVLVRKNGKTLYRVMVETFRPGVGWRPDGYIHLHAANLGEAKIAFNRASYGRARRIALNGFGIAPAVGFYVHDKHGEKLSA
jgi:hypothetical protein